jgi:hypothetical protein
MCPVVLFSEWVAVEGNVIVVCSSKWEVLQRDTVEDKVGVRLWAKM